MLNAGALENRFKFDKVATNPVCQCRNHQLCLWCSMSSSGHEEYSNER